MLPFERAWKTIQENGMVCYVYMHGSQDINKIVGAKYGLIDIEIAENKAAIK